MEPLPASSAGPRSKAASPPPVVKPKEVELKSATEGVDAYGRPLKKVVEKTPAEIAYEEKMRKRVRPGPAGSSGAAFAATLTCSAAARPALSGVSVGSMRSG